MIKSKTTMSYKIKFILSLLVFILMFIAAMVLGAADTSLRDVWLAITTSLEYKKILIIREIRFPRTIGAILVGAALGVSGAIMQGITRNPLADPGLIGLTAGANMALAFTIAFVKTANYFVIVVACFIGATIGAALVFGISSINKGGFNPLRIVLSGSAITLLLNAISEAIGIYFRISKDISMWSAGGLMGTNWNQLKIISLFIFIGLLISIFYSKQLTILSLSDEVAIGLGQNISKIKGMLFMAIIILTGASVALAGNIVFIGLMIPHIVRFIVGNDYKHIIPISILLGATLMLLSDTLSRTISAPYEIPVTAIVSIMGLPFFLFIVHRGRKMFL